MDWVGDDVWFAHSVYVNAEEIDVFAKHHCGVAHCPTSNMRLASGIAPIREYLAAGVNVGLGVDGSASNDGSHLLAEVRQAMLLSRLTGRNYRFLHLSNRSRREETDMTPAKRCAWGRTAARRCWAARISARSSLGSARISSPSTSTVLDYAGALHDPVSAVVFCQPVRVDYTVVGGKFIVKQGQLITVDERKLVEKHNQAAKRLVEG